MSVGLGIFLASVIVSLTLLYINKHKVIEPQAVERKFKAYSTAKKVLKVGFLIILFGCVVLGIIIWMESEPKKQDSYDGIKLGMTMQEIEYIKGQPTELSSIKMPINSPIPSDETVTTTHPGYWLPDILSNTLQDSDNIFNYPNWRFQNDKETVEINFDRPNGKVVAVSCAVIPRGNYFDLFDTNCPTLSGIGIGTSEDDLKKRLGNSDFEKISGSKEIVFRKFNARFILHKQRIYYIEFKDPEWGDGSNLFDPSTAVPVTDKPFDPDTYLKSKENKAQK